MERDSKLAEAIRKQAVLAKQASRALALVDASTKNRALAEMARELDEGRAEVFEANRLDYEAAVKAGLSAALLDRLRLDDKRLDAMIYGIEDVIRLNDPVGEVLEESVRPNGLEIKKTRVPIGVIGIIFESRPNVTVDAAVLCIKSGNAVILRGGKEAQHSNRVLVKLLQHGASSGGIPADAIQFVDTIDRRAVTELVQLEGIVDLVIPRGGEGLIRAVAADARIPVIKHYKGVCHIYVDDSADTERALDIIENAKCQRPGVCNAAETVLIHKKIAGQFLPKLVTRLEDRGVEVRGDARSKEISPSIKAAEESDWSTEYLDLILSIAIVGSVADAVEHINKYGSGHSDSILTTTERSAEYFLSGVDSAAVYLNASTRFTDGGEFGLGAEIGISTDKIHARGPMGLAELTSYKFVVRGNGQIRP
jgi:glutamate-5-semialdehyde dehydrogenase